MRVLLHLHPNVPLRVDILRRQHAQPQKKSTSNFAPPTVVLARSKDMVIKAFVLRSENGLVDVLLTKVAHVPDLRYHLISLPTLIKHGYIFDERPTGAVVGLKSERSIVFPLSGIVFSLHGHRVDYSNRKIPMLYSPRGKRPTSLRLTSATYIALMNTLMRFNSARLRSSKG